jgi:iron-sulfur cluster repair protein YtfE (RIC family)
MEKLREELVELKEAVQTMEKIQSESGTNPKTLEAKKKDIHSEMADVLEIKNTVIEHFTGDMPID